MKLFLEDLRLNLSGDVLTDKVSLGIYATDASVYQIFPKAIVIPKNEQDVVTAIKIAKDYCVSILPRGGGTSLAGQTVGNSMIIDFSKYMNSVLEFNEAERWVRVQPGIVRDQLNIYLRQFGLHFAPDPATSSRANIGGMIGNNSSGTKSVLFGKTVDHVLEMNVLLPNGVQMLMKNLSKEELLEKCKSDGIEANIYDSFKEIINNNKEEIFNRFPKVMRRVQGYNLDEFIGDQDWNLSKLICGSEGTLATILNAKLNLEPLPKFKSICVVHFEQLPKAIESVSHMLEHNPSAIEILDNTVIKLSKENLTTRHHTHFIEGNPAAIQIVEFYGETLEAVTQRPSAMVEQLKELGLGYAYPTFQEGQSYEDVWVIRKKGLGLMLGMKGNKKPLAFIEDAGVPIDSLPSYIEEVLQVCRDNHTEAAMYAHASVGVIHVRPILDLRLTEDIERFKNISRETFKLVKKYGGSWSGEHGDGLVRSVYLKEYFGEQVYQALIDVKKLFDPENRMNPGKIVDAQDIDQNLRYGAGYKDQKVETVFKYREDGSFKNAVHMCTGVGECRKLTGGTMCPSFKATMDEEHSTRGRANALRMAMSGQLDEAGLLNKEVKDTMDLCISCKACKSECPSNVDMAKLKSEVNQKHYKKYGSSLRDKLIRDSAKAASKMAGNKAGLANTFLKNNVVKSLVDIIIGFDKRRSLPQYTKQTFSVWYQKNYKTNPEKARKVILFVDTYLNYHEPNIGIAATRLLDKLGFNVLITESVCCQRPKISHGFLEDAKKKGVITAESLSKHLDGDTKIVVCEPSCASALIDDLPDLMDDEKTGERIKKHVTPISNFIADILNQGSKNISLESSASKILFHGHCHQKALFGTGSIKQIFDHVSNLQFEEILSGCCGMAGSFGYEKEHYTISRKIGELELLPAVRNADPATTIVASGFSCRHQIRDFAGREVKHWIEVLV